MYSNDQYDEFIAKLHEKFPAMFSEKYGGIVVDSGWWPIIESLSSNIQHHIDSVAKTRQLLLKDNPWNRPIPEEVPPVVVEQIKEKFGGLRFYYSGGDDHIYGMVRMAESWASKTCEVCGKPGEIRSGGWIKTLCDEHEVDRQNRMVARTTS